jgi:hypothetical protein
MPLLLQTESIMKRIAGAIAFASAALVSSVWAQSASQPAATAPAAPAATQSANSDEIVKMRMEIAHANKIYDKKVAAAKKVFDHKKAEAAKERDTAVAAARNGTTQ